MKYFVVISMFLFPPVAVAQLAPDEASGVASTVKAGNEIRSAIQGVGTLIRGSDDPALAEAVAMLIVAGGVSVDITGDLVGAEAVQAKFAGRTRQQTVDDAKRFVGENIARLGEAAAILSGAGFAVPNGLNAAVALYSSFPDLSYLDFQHSTYPGLVGVSPDGKNIHGDYDLAVKWSRHTLFYGHDSWRAVVVDYVAGEYNAFQRGRVERFFHNFAPAMNNMHKELAMILGICDNGFCTDSRFFFMQEVQRLSASGARGTAGAYQNAMAPLSDLKVGEDHTPDLNCAGGDCWSLAMLQFFDSWRGIDKASASVIGEFEGRAGIDFESRDLIIVDLEAQLLGLESDLAECESGGGGDCSSFIERIAEKNLHLRTIETLAAQRTEL